MAKGKKFRRMFDDKDEIRKERLVYREPPKPFTPKPIVEYRRPIEDLAPDAGWMR